VQKPANHVFFPACRQSSGALPGQTKAADRGQAKVAEVTGSRRPKAAEKQTAKKIDNPQPRPSKTPTKTRNGTFTSAFLEIPHKNGGLLSFSQLAYNIENKVCQYT